MGTLMKVVLQLAVVVVVPVFAGNTKINMQMVEMMVMKVLVVVVVEVVVWWW